MKEVLKVKSMEEARLNTEGPAGEQGQAWGWNSTTTSPTHSRFIDEEAEK